MRLLPAFLLITACFAAAPVFAGHPDQSDGDRAAKREKFCQDNPAKCEEIKARREKMREACKANPEKCKERRKELRERRKERSEAFCKEHPDKCDGKENERPSGPPR